jgi:hypothetical protein
VVLAAAPVMIVVVSRGNPRPREYWELPVGFRGWIVVEYGKPACPPLARDGDAIVYYVPQSGRLCTSDALPSGFAQDTFEFVLSNGWRVQLGDAMARKRLVDAASRLLLFVGSADEEEAALKNLPPEFR